MRIQGQENRDRKKRNWHIFYRQKMPRVGGLSKFGPDMAIFGSFLKVTN